MLGLELLLTSTDSKCVLLVSQHGLKKVQELNTSQRVNKNFSLTRFSQHHYDDIQQCKGKEDVSAMASRRTTCRNEARESLCLINKKK